MLPPLMVRHSWRLVRFLLVCWAVLCCAQPAFPVAAPPAVSTGPWVAAHIVQGISSDAGEERHAYFFSAALDRWMDYWIYLPPGYAVSTQRYPVLYMLHGRGGSAAQWRSWGLFDQADRLIRQAQIAPLLIVTPQGDDGYWMNHANGGPRWGDYVTTDLITYIDGTYRTLPDRQHRAIGGVSMGGDGAILLALTHPLLFSTVGGHSPVFRRPAQAFAFFGVGTAYQQHDPLSLVRDLRVAVPFHLWIDMGIQDGWLPATLEFHHVLAQRGITHSWHLFPGGHQGAYWQAHVPMYLCWYDAALHGRPDGQCHPPGSAPSIAAAVVPSVHR